MKSLLTSAAILLGATGLASAATVEIAAWDTNADGSVDASEYTAGMAAANVTVTVMSVDEIQEWIRVNNPDVVVTGADTNSDGELQKSEVTIEGQGEAVTVTTGQTDGMTVTTGRGDGVSVTTGQADGVTVTSGNADGVTVTTEQAGVVTQDEARPEFKAFDLDRNGRLDPAEFARWQEFAVKVGIFTN